MIRPASRSPDVAIMAMVESASAAARAGTGLDDALQAAAGGVAQAVGWPVGHALVPSGPALWSPARVWYETDPLRFARLRTGLLDAPPAPLRGVASLAADLVSAQWSPLDPSYRLARSADLIAGVAVPVVVGGVPIAVLEWYAEEADRPAPDLLHGLAHLAAVVADVAVSVPGQRVRD